MTSRTDLVIMVGIPVLAVLFMAWVIFATIPVDKQITGMLWKMKSEQRWKPYA